MQKDLLAHYIDSHAHLDCSDYATDREAVIQDIFASGCIAIVNPGVDISSSHASIELSEKHERIFAGIGIHPNEVLRYMPAGNNIFDFILRDIETLRKLADHTNVVAIGECGLDYYRIQSEDAQVSKIQELQKKLFRLQLALAVKKDIPVIMHIRDAYEDAVELLDMTEGNLRGVAHCYEGSWPMTQILLSKGFYIGFTANITYPKKEEIHEVIKKIPLERILLETDAPYLSPQIHRGKRNDSRGVLEVGKQIAEIQRIAAEEVFLQTTKNAILLFGLPVLDR